MPNFDPSWSYLCASCRLERRLALSVPPLVTVGFSPSEQFLGHDFRFAMMVEKAAVGRARKARNERDRTRSDQTEGRSGEEEKGGGQAIVLISIGEALQIPVCRIHQDETKQL